MSSKKIIDTLIFNANNNNSSRLLTTATFEERAPRAGPEYTRPSDCVCVKGEGLTVFNSVKFGQKTGCHALAFPAGEKCICTL